MCEKKERRNNINVFGKGMMVSVIVMYGQARKAQAWTCFSLMISEKTCLG